MVAGTMSLRPDPAVVLARRPLSGRFTSTGTAAGRRRRRHGDVLAAHQEPQLVWVGVSGGAGGLDDGQMTEVRRAVAEGRAERLQAQKLTDIKPYSRHG
mmetsp:Transcript_18479/g.59984  ORF Transcript_18479/g.59984 Transcript_18479/m.59984 type:complete len:99 (+) Transcript_18479:582-878(+)